MGIGFLIGFFVVLAVLGLLFALAVYRQMNRPRPALPANCGDCAFMIPRARVYRRETIESDDGLIHYLCQQRWIEITPYSPRCALGRSKSRTTNQPA
ncbi:hypothetical protein BH18CHL2_BH18CHL2_10770 [soil metagenome]